ncbi:MAG: mechanosensitive ion channel domain-containing protein [Ekhidna sp.]
MKTLESLLETLPLFQISVTFGVLLAYLIVRKIIFGVVLRRAMKHNFEEARAVYIRKAVSLGVAFLFIIFIGMVWEISLKGLSVYIASFLTIVGVGLFANWSIVSNITASVILFFFFPFKIGSKVRILDGDNSAEGEVIDLSLFSIRLKKDDGNDIYVPNNIAIQKSIVHLG